MAVLFFVLMLPAFFVLLLMALRSGSNADKELLRLLEQRSIRQKQ